VKEIAFSCPVLNRFRKKIGEIADFFMGLGGGGLAVP